MWTINGLFLVQSGVDDVTDDVLALEFFLWTWTWTSACNVDISYILSYLKGFLLSSGHASGARGGGRCTRSPAIVKLYYSEV